MNLDNRKVNSRQAFCTVADFQNRATEEPKAFFAARNANVALLEVKSGQGLRARAERPFMALRDVSAPASETPALSEHMDRGQLLLATA